MKTGATGQNAKEFLNEKDASTKAGGAGESGQRPQESTATNPAKVADTVEQHE